MFKFIHLLKQIKPLALSAALIDSVRKIVQAAGADPAVILQRPLSEKALLDCQRALRVFHQAIHLSDFLLPAQASDLHKHLQIFLHSLQQQGVIRTEELTLEDLTVDAKTFNEQMEMLKIVPRRGGDLSGLESTTDLLAIHTYPDLSVVMLSELFQSLLADKDVSTATGEWFDWIHPEDLVPTFAALSALLEEKQQTIHYESRLRIHLGSDEPVYLSVHWTVGRHENYVYVMGRPLTKQLPLTMAGSEIKAVVSQQTSRERELIAVLFHELRNSLNGMLGNAQLTRASLNGLLTSMEEYQEASEMQVDVPVLQQELKNLKTHVKTIEICGKDQLAILNQVLDFNKLQQAHVELELQPFALRRDVLKPLIAVYSPLSEEKNIRFQVEAPETEKWLVGDAYRLKQILTNLLSNALKFAAPASTESSACIQLKCSLPEAKTDQSLHFTVTNTGPGLNSSQIAQLFKPYSQTDSSIVRRFGGTGLGLSVCKQLLELMKGEIVCRSSVSEQWVQFEMKLSLPIAQKKRLKRDSSPEEKGTESRQKKKLLASNLRVLVAEDNEVNQKIARQMLEKFPCLVDIVMNGREAVTRCSEQVYSLVFMDIQMPEMDGLEATRVIRAAEKTRTDSALAPLPIIGLSAEALTEQQAKAREAGMTDYLTKPFSAADLYKKLMQHARQIPRGSPLSSERTLLSNGSTFLPSSRCSPSLFTRRISSSTKEDSKSYLSSGELTDPPSSLESTSPMIEDSLLLMPSSQDRARFFSENQEVARLKAQVAELELALQSMQQQVPTPPFSEEKILKKGIPERKNFPSDPPLESEFLSSWQKPRRRQQNVVRTSSNSPLLRSSSTSHLFSKTHYRLMEPASVDREAKRQLAECRNDPIKPVKVMLETINDHFQIALTSEDASLPISLKQWTEALDEFYQQAKLEQQSFIAPTAAKYWQSLREQAEQMPAGPAKKPLERFAGLNEVAWQQHVGALKKGLAISCCTLL